MLPQNVHDLVLRPCEYLKAQEGEVPGLSDGSSVTTKVLIRKEMRRQWKLLLLRASKMEEGTGSQGEWVPLEAGKVRGQTLLRVPRGTGSADILVCSPVKCTLDSDCQNRKMRNLCWCKPPSVWSFVRGALRNENEKEGMNIR